MRDATSRALKIVAALMLLLLGCLPSAHAQAPVSPTNGEPVTADDVVLRWTLDAGRESACVEWSYRPEVASEGGRFLDPAGEDCDGASSDVALLLSNLRVARYYWHVGTEGTCPAGDPYYGECPNRAFRYGPTAHFDSVEPPPPPYPSDWPARAAKVLKTDVILPGARDRRPSYYDGVKDSWWGVTTVLCRDLTGNEREEMIVQLSCCTGGSLSPWAIFTHDATRNWRLAYLRVSETTWRLVVRGTKVRAMIRLRTRARAPARCAIAS